MPCFPRACLRHSLLQCVCHNACLTAKMPSSHSVSHFMSLGTPFPTVRPLTSLSGPQPAHNLNIAVAPNRPFSDISPAICL